MTLHFTLSLEEIAFAFAALGRSELAASFLKTTVGDLHPDNLTGRLTAASHSLIARDLFALTSDSGTPALDEQLAQTLQVVLDADHSLRCSRSTGTIGEEAVLTLYLKGERLVSNRMIQEVVAHLLPLDRAELATQLLAFIGDGVGTLGEGNEALGTISADQLQLVRREAVNRPIETVVARLDPYFPRTVAEAIAGDFARPSVTWGSVIRLASQEVADRDRDDSAGLLYAAVDGRLWLFHIAPDNQAVAHAYRGDRALLEQLVESLTV